MNQVKKKVVLCVPTVTKPYQQTLNAIEASIPALEEAGWDHAMVSEVGCPYISQARATMLRKALDAKATAIVFIDHDVSWRPGDLVKLLEADGEYVLGTYRFKRDVEEYMGKILTGETGRPLVRDDGAIQSYCGPAGFMKITPRAVNMMMQAYPELAYGDLHTPCFDFFHHGAHQGLWWGEDYAACRRWVDAGYELWTIPDLELTHWGSDGKAYVGNLHEYLLRRPGGAKEVKQ